MPHLEAPPPRGKLWSALLAFFERRGKFFILTAGFTLVGIIGVLDFYTGFEVSFAVFYLLPVVFVSWFAGWRYGVVTAVVSATTWQLANWLAGETFTSAAIPLWNASTRLIFFILAALFSTQKKVAEHERELARTDHLTRVANARAFDEAVQAEVSRSRRYAHPFTVAYMDVDDFKRVNDKLGHSVGDDLLRSIAQTIGSNVRETDVVARLGGDEFALLMPETGGESAQAAVRKIQAALRQKVHGKGWGVTVSVGVLTCTAPPHTTDELLKMADELMYSVKSRGKDAIAYQVLEGSNVARGESESGQRSAG